MKTDRRTFFSGIGSLVAVAALPTFAKDDQSLFPTRGNFERVQIGFQHIHIGLPEPFSVLHISDTHLTEVDERDADWREFALMRRKTFGGCQEEALADSLAWAKKNVDYVIHTGDLMDFSSEANIDLARKYYGESAGLMFGCVGNHEYSRRKDEDAFAVRKRVKRAYSFDPSFQSTVVKGVNFINIEQVFGMVRPEQVERFAAEVKKGLPIVLCMHVPFFTDYIAIADDAFWHNDKRLGSMKPPPPHGDWLTQTKNAVTQDFIKYLKGEKLLKGILCGHLHIDIQDRFSPTAMEYVVGANFMPHGEKILFS